MRFIILFTFLTSSLVITGCSIRQKVLPLAENLNQPREICIVKNKKVVIKDFLIILIEGISRNGFKTITYDATPSDKCRYILKYAAYQKWDGVNFLSKADIQVFTNHSLVGSISYALPKGIFGGGGLNFKKWGSTRKKMDPLIDTLFENFKDIGVTSNQTYDTQEKNINETALQIKTDPTIKLRQVKKLFDDGVISKVDFEAKKQELLKQIK